MSELRVASRYAKSLIDLAQERQELETVFEDMLLIENTCQDSRELRLMLGNPIIKDDKKQAVLKIIFGGKVSDMTQAFIQIVARKNRAKFLFPIAKAFHHQYNLLKGIEQATVITPMPLDASLKAEVMALIQKVAGKKVELDEQIDAELIGGFVLQIGDKQIDRSLRTQLQTLKRTFSQK